MGLTFPLLRDNIANDMWEALVMHPRGRVSLRNFLMFFATVIVASFIFVGASSAVVSAAADAEWKGEDIVYAGDTYTGPIDTADLRGLKGIPQGSSIYQSIEKISDYQVAHIIYFQAGGVPKSAKEAYYTTYTFNPPGSYTKPGGKIPISITPVANDPLAAANTDTTCAVDGVGWMVCNVSSWIADGMDMIYTVVAGFLTVQPLTNSNTSLYAAWGFMRNLANLAFIIGFLVIIYYHLVGTVDAKYALRKIIPRVVLVAVLVNVSYWIVAAGVDISNIAGYSIQEMFNGLRNQMGAANTDAAALIGWKTITAVVLSGGAATYAGIAALGGSTAFSATSMSLLLIAALLPALFALFVAFAILAVRQALITIFIIISPLAFVAYLLPNTEEWFTRWRKLFMSLLIMFPAFSVIFGGAQLAGIIIIQNAPKSLLGIAIVILGLVVQTVPLFITPFLIKLSSGLMGTIAGMVNNRSKGLFDRSKNWADDRRDYHKARAMAQATPNSSFRRRAGAHYGMKKHHRERMKSAYTSQAEALYERTGRGQRAYRETRLGEDQKEGAKNYNEELFQRRVVGDVDPTQRTRRERMFQGHADAQDQRFGEHQQLLHESHAAGVRAGIIKDAVHEQGERHVREAINNAAPGTYSSRIREAQQQTIVDKGVADLYKGRVEAIGEQDFREEVADSRTLTRVVQDTHHAKKQAEAYETIVNKAAERSWSSRVVNDDATQTLYLRAKRNEDSAELAEQRVKEFAQNVRTLGGTAPNVTAQAVAYADEIKDTFFQTDISKNAESAAQKKEQAQIASQYEHNTALRMRAGGIGGQAAANLVLARAIQTKINNQIEGTKAEKSILSQTESNELFKRLDDPNASVEQLAAYAGTIAERGFHADHIRLLDKVSRMYQEAVDSDDEERIGVMKDVIQQVSADQSKVAFGISDHDRTLLSEGRYNSNIYKTTRERIMTNLAPDAMANLDPDDILLLYELDQNGFLTEEQHNKILESYEAWKKDSILGPKLKDKARNIFERIKDPSITGDWNGNAEPPKQMYGITDNDLKKPRNAWTP